MKKSFLDYAEMDGAQFHREKKNKLKKKKIHKDLEWNSQANLEAKYPIVPAFSVLSLSQFYVKVGLTSFVLLTDALHNIRTLTNIPAVPSALKDLRCALHYRHRSPCCPCGVKNTLSSGPCAISPLSLENSSLNGHPLKDSSFI